ncbi:MAG: hypothetical protein AAFV53_08370 [Myxococcota bacterium]
MTERIIEVADGFWNIRGVFRIAGFINIGTHASLVRRNDGSFVLIDSYTLPDDVLRQVRDLTDQGKDIDAIINVHPFHTIHVESMYQQFPNARLFGSQRHKHKAPGLTWQDVDVDDPEMNVLFDDLQFSVPAGVDFISDDPNIHFSSVLVYHPASKTVHVDDTFNYITLPIVGGFSFHPTLGQALEARPGATDDFRRWARDVATRWGDAQNICAAHNGNLTGIHDFGERVRTALKRSERTLKKHERRL